METKERTKIKKDLVKRVNLIILKTKRVEISMIIEDKNYKDHKDQKVKDLDITMEGTAMARGTIWTKESLSKRIENDIFLNFWL